MKTYQLLIITALLNICSLNVNAINDKLIKQLKTDLIQTNNNVTKCDIAIKIANEYWTEDPKNMMTYADLAINLIQKTNEFKYYAMAYNTKSTACGNMQLLDSMIHFSKLALKAAKISKNDYQIWDAYNGLSYSFYRNSDYITSLKYYDTTISLAIPGKFEKPINNCLLGKADCYFRMGDLNNAEKYYKNGLDLALQENDTENTVKYYNNYSSLKIMQGIVNDTIVSYINKVIQSAEKNKNKINMASGYATLGAALSIQTDYEQAILNYKKSLKLYADCSDSLNLAVANINIAENYYLLKINDSASKYAYNGRILSEKVNFGTGVHLGNAIFANQLLDSNKLSNLENQLMTNYNLAKLNNDNYSLGYLTVVLAKYHKITGQFAKSNSFYLKAKELALINKNNNILQDCYQSLASNYSKLGNYKYAFEFNQKLATLNDTMYSNNNNLIVRKLNTLYQTKEKQLLYQQTLHEKSILKQKILVLVICLMTLCALMASLFYFYKKLKNTKLALDIEKNNVEYLNRTIQHEVLNQFTSINAGLQLKSLDDSRKVLNAKNKTYALIKTYKNLYLSPLKGTSSLNQVFIEIFEDHCIGLKKTPQLIINGNVSIKLNNIEYLFRIMIELITNSIKYAFINQDNPIITINLSKKNNQVEINYLDNGIGHEYRSENIIKGHGTDIILNGITQTLNGTLEQESTHKGVNLKIKILEDE
jgi:two-component sensor histidine kinase